MDVYGLVVVHFIILTTGGKHVYFFEIANTIKPSSFMDKISMPKRLHVRGDV